MNVTTGGGAWLINYIYNSINTLWVSYPYFSKNTGSHSLQPWLRKYYYSGAEQRVGQVYNTRSTVVRHSCITFSDPDHCVS